MNELEVIAVYESHEAKLTQKVKRNLQVKVLPYSRMPEMYTKDGHRAVLAYTIQPTKADGGKSFQYTNKSKFSLIKLPKGSVINYDGSVSIPNDKNGPTLRVKVNDDKNNEFFQIMTLNSDPPEQESDQIANILEVVKVFAIPDKITPFIDIYDATKVYMDGKTMNPNNLIALTNTSFALLVVLADMIATDKANEINNEYNRSMKIQIENAKKRGLDEVTKIAKRSQNGNLKYGRPAPLDAGAVEYRVLDDVAESTLTKLLAGEFKTFNDLLVYRDNQFKEELEVSILYKVIGDGASPDDLYIVETIFY